MPCESCAIQFSVFKRKRACSECDRMYCSGCLRRGGGAMCAPCRLLSTRPLSRHNIANLKVRDLQCFLQRQNVSTRGCVEKEELVSLCVSHVNSAAYRRRGGRGAGAFSSLKGLTTNINEFINSTFDIRPNQPPPPTTQPCNCFNSSHVHTPPSRPAPAPAAPPQRSASIPERFTTTPGGERAIHVPVPAPPPPLSPDEPSAPLDSADCFEIEDLDDAGWEFVNRPADPLPNDSELLLSTPDGVVPQSPPAPRTLEPTDEERPAAAPGEQRPRDARDDERTERARRGAEARGAEPSPGMGARAASELELRGERLRPADTSSLKDEGASAPGTPARPDARADVRLEELESEEQLEALSVRQLKALLVRGCVAYRGCVERAELVALARRLWRGRAAGAGAEDDTCRICMAAPLDCVLLECGHVVACAACARRLPECPLCRAYVVRAVRIFRS